MTYIKNFINDEEGQDLVEYALLISFIALAATAALTLFGTSIGGYYGALGIKVDAAAAR